MSISKYILDAHEEKTRDAQMRNQWMIKIRWIYVTILLTIAVASTLAAHTPKALIGTYVFVGGAGLAFNFLLFFAARHKSRKYGYYQLVGLLQVLLDIVLASYIIYTQGLYSRGTLLYAIPILAGGLIILGAFSYYAAGLATMCYGVVLYLYILNHPYFHTYKDMVVPLFFYGGVMFILAMIVSYFNRLNAESERDQSYTQLLSLMRHQLHHPSGVIAALLDVIEHSESYKNLASSEKNHLKLIKHENRTMEDMITNLLETLNNPTKSYILKTEDINLIHLLEEIAQSCALSMGREADLNINYPVKSMIVNGQSQQLRVAFANLIDNAFRYSENGKKVEISVSEHEPVVEIAVVDHGEGMSTNHIKELMHKFSHYEEAGGESSIYGMGLGLYVSKTIIERHGGKIEIKSYQGKGTMVTIKLREKGSPK